MKIQTGPVRILVTAVAGGSIGEQVIKALRLSTLPLWIATANVSGAEAAQNVVAADARFTLPRSDSPDYLRKLVETARECGARFVVPGSEAELQILVKHTPLLVSAGLLLLANTPSLVATCLDKNLFSRALRDLGFKTPETLEPVNPDEVLVPASGFPVVLKPATGGGGSAMTFIAQDLEELAFFQRYLFRSGIRPLLQEYVGMATQEYTVGVLHLPDGTHAGTAVMRRNILDGMSNRIRIPNRTGRLELGPVLAISSGVTQGTFVTHEAVALAAKSIAEALGSRGPLNIQGRWNGSEFVVFEGNPRFSGTTPMRALAGFNEPELLINHLLGGSSLIPPAAIRGGTFSRGLVETFSPDGSFCPTDI